MDLKQREEKRRDPVLKVSGYRLTFSLGVLRAAGCCLLSVVLMRAAGVEVSHAVSAGRREKKHTH